MIRSMTGYGSAAVHGEELRAAVSVRCLNHRFLDVNLHVSRALAPLEPEIKSLVQSRVGRGRVEVSVHAVLKDEATEVSLGSRSLVASMIRVLRELQAEHGLDGGVRVGDIARFPGALEVIEGPRGMPDATRGQVLGLVREALDGLDFMRRAEGERLAAELGRCLDAVQVAADRLESLAEAGREARREALLAKARGLTAELGLDEGRLYQELMRLLDRHDVSEELQRLRSHVAQARSLLGQAAPSGKRLDFLGQELMREANTVGSKAVSVEMVQEVVGLKTEIERLREQVQNVE